MLCLIQNTTHCNANQDELNSRLWQFRKSKTIKRFVVEIKFTYNPSELHIDVHFVHL